MQGSKLQELLQQSDHISQILEYLKNTLISSPSINNQIQDPTQYLQKSIDLRMAFRFLVDGIETNRQLVQIQKEQIQRKKVFLQGLQYYKATLKNQIASSRIDITSVYQYIQAQPSDSIDWIQDYPKQQQKILSTLQQFKQKKQQYEQKQIKKQQLTKQMAIQQQKYKKTFPQQIKKLYSQVSETSKLFNIKEIDTMAISQFKSKRIEQIHSILYPLKIKQFIDLKHINQFDTEELQVTIQKGFYPLYEFARQNKIMIEQKQLRFYIAAVHKEINQNSKEQVMAVSISRRQDFSTQQIFNNILLQQKVKPIYLNPTTQAQRNTNTKYSQLNWIGQILGSPSSLINGNQFIQKIKSRVFNLNLIRYAIDNMTKKVPPYFFGLFKQSQQGSRMTNYTILDSKKLMITKCQKSNFEQYQKQVYIPEWVHKAIINLNIIKEEEKQNKISNKLASCSAQRKLLNIYIQNNNLQELEISDFYSYYKFQMIVEKNVLTGFILIPSNYPNRRSVIKLINYKKPIENSLPLVNGNKTISLTFEKDEIQSNYKYYSQQLKQVETQLNDKIDTFLYKGSNKGSILTQEQKRKQPFILYFQINRLISIFIEKSLQK